MSSDIYYNPNYESRLSRQNSLPTYEEATGQVQQILPAPSTSTISINDSVNELQSSHIVRASSASPSFAVDNLNEHRPLNADGRPGYQSNTQPPANTSSRFKNQRGLHQSAVNQHTNPVVRQTVQMNLEETENARTKARNNKFAECIGLAVVVFLGLVLIGAKLTTKLDRLSSESTDWISQPHRHDWTD